MPFKNLPHCISSLHTKREVLRVRIGRLCRSKTYHTAFQLYTPCVEHCVSQFACETLEFHEGGVVLESLCIRDQHFSDSQLDKNGPTSCTFLGIDTFLILLFLMLVYTTFKMQHSALQLLLITTTLLRAAAQDLSQLPQCAVRAHHHTSMRVFLY